MEYSFSDIEKKWKKYWNEHKVYQVTNDTSKPKFYILDMFPYPSGAGLHVGHPLGYIASDIYARYKRQRGFNVLHPMGYDAFGLPAEQYALETGQHPAVTTEKNIARYREQLDNIGFCYDWDREVRTSDPKYYKWTQWIFLQLFHSFYDRSQNKTRPVKELVALFEKEGNISHACPGDGEIIFDAAGWKDMSETEQRNVLMKYRVAFLDYAEVWWCEALGTVLANDEVVNGVSERGGHPVVKKQMRQWFLRITEFAERLLTSLDKLEWSEAMKEMQRNWIGKSKGAQVGYKLAGGKQVIEVFTTRPDTIFGVDFMVLAPEHELVDTITTADQKQPVEEYKKYVQSRSERERMTEVKQVTGAFTGAYAIHPFTGRNIPVWISEYVLAGYGTGAIMGVPSGDDRDHAFAKHFSIPITNIFGDKYTGENAYVDKAGKVENSDFLDGLEVPAAIETAIQAIEDKGIGYAKVNYKMRDAGFSRQRYWGEPFPIVYKGEVPYAIDEVTEGDAKDILPVELPYVESYKPGPEGQGPLANLEDWVNLTPGPSPQVERGDNVPNQSQKAEIGANVNTSPQMESVSYAPTHSQQAENVTNVPKYEVKDVKLYEKARANRKGHTEAEAALWQELRNNNLGDKFRRQHPVDSYIVDFVCLNKALIIEVDGGYHEDAVQKEYDDERTRILETIGFKLVRFTNEEVLNNVGNVLNQIKTNLTQQATYLSSQTGTPSPFENSFSNHVTPSPFMEKGPGVEVRREVNTMPGYAGSSWYFLRYMDPHNGETFAGKNATDYWREVDIYIGGTEHAVGHLLYSRMWTKALYDLGHISFEEPFKKLVNQGMIQGSSRFVYRINGTNEFVSTGLKHKYLVDEMHVDVTIVDGVELNTELFKKWKPEFESATFMLDDGKYICGSAVEKMSKSKYNVVNPDDIVTQFGADTFRMYEMFLGPIDVSKPWDTKGIEGVHRFIKKMWRLYFEEHGLAVTDEPATEAELRILHKTIKKVGEDIERFSFNTSVAQFMICVNELSSLNCRKREVLEKLPPVIASFAPHFAEELWHQLGNTTTVLDAEFPLYDEKYTTENTKKYPVAVNGKTRAEMEFPLDMEQAVIEKEVLADEAIIKWLEGKEPKKFIYVKGKMINVVV